VLLRLLVAVLGFAKIEEKRTRPKPGPGARTAMSHAAEGS